MAGRMSPAKQSESREKQIASMATPAQRDSALAEYNVEKARAQAKARLAAATADRPTPQRQGLFGRVQAGMDALLRSLNTKPKGR